ncbi:MAG: autotransporter-associated beta strand repeat-containing protein [Gloeobacteraceae cyanobacterium ES-bin-144]|nr:autotransporter-associated beta strand repeat-containing protein [Verrucomicrobiales bacterium]
MNGGAASIVMLGTNTQLSFDNNATTGIFASAGGAIQGGVGAAMQFLTATGASEDVGTADDTTLTIQVKISGGSFESWGGADNAGVVVLTNYQNDFTLLRITSGIVSSPAIGNSGSAGPLGTDGVIDLNANYDSATAATLRYTGNGETTNKGLNLFNGSGTAKLEANNPTGLFKMTGSVVSSSSPKTLQLAGTGVAEIFGNINETSGINAVSVRKTGEGTWTLGGTNGFTGTTTVDAGILAVTGNALPNNGQLSIHGGKVEVIGSESVGSLFFDGTQQLAGTWGSTLSTATFKDDGHFSGTGVLVVANGPTDSYTPWIESLIYNSPALTATQKLPNADPDNDGVSNIMEFVLGGNPVVSSSAILPMQTLDATSLVLTFKRRDSSESGTFLTAQVSDNLTSWTNIPAIPIGPSPSAFTSIVENVGNADDDVTVRIPRNGSSKRFVRLSVMK